MKKSIALSILFTLLFYILFLFTNPLYLSTDSQEVAVVVDGLYGSNNFCQFLHPLLCMIIKPLNTLLPITDVFTTLLHLAVFFNFFLLLYLGFEGLPALRQMSLQDYLRIALTILSITFLSAGVVICGAQGTVLCVDTMKLLHMPARRINLAAQIHTHGKFDFWADWPDTLTQ